MRFIPLIALRELRSSWRRLAFFFACIALGVGSIVTLRSLIGSVGEWIQHEARAINLGDVQLRSTRGWSEQATALIDAQAGIVRRVDIAHAPTMLRPASESASARMVDVRAVSSGYPLCGEVLTDVGAFSVELLANNGVLLSQAVAAQYGLARGDRVALGNAQFEVRGLVLREPDDGLVSLGIGARVLVGLDDARAAGLLAHRTRVSERIVLTVAPERHDAVVAALKDGLANEMISVRDYKQTESGLSEQLERADAFLSLVAAAILVLGGTGVWSVTRVFVRQRLHTIAVLKCLGGRSSTVISAYALQMVGLGIVGGLGGVALAAVTLALIARWLEGGPLDVVTVAISPAAALHGIGIGALVALLFSLSPLLGIRSVRPNLLLRSTDLEHTSRWEWGRLVGALTVGAGLAGLVVAQAGLTTPALLFSAGFATALGALRLASGGLVRALRLFPLRRFTIRYAIRALERPGNQARAVVMAVGLGVFVLMTVHWMRTTFQASLDRQTTADLPDLYFVDVQVDQMAPLAEMVERVSGHGADLVLTAPARIAGIDGEEIDLERVESVVDRQRLSRDYIVTTKTELAPNEEVVDGEWWPPSPGLAPEVSVDTSLAEDFGFTVNRRLLLDLRGTRIEARIAAVRKIDWAKGRLGFMIAFRPGSLDNIAMSAVGAVIGPADTQARGRLVRELSDRFPNVSILDTRDVVASLRQALASIGTALSIVGGVVVVAGLLILIGSVSMTRFLREYEIAVLKTLGARWRQIAMVNALEFVVLGGLAGVIGTALAGVLVWVLAEQVLDLDFAVDAVGAVVAFIASALVVGAAGVAATADLLMVRPLALLRGE